MFTKNGHKKWPQKRCRKNVSNEFCLKNPAENLTSYQQPVLILQPPEVHPAPVSFVLGEVLIDRMRVLNVVGVGGVSGLNLSDLAGYLD
jgi:hypothetical protein